MVGTRPTWRLQSAAVISRLFSVAVLTLVFIVAAVLVGVDIGARIYTEHQIASRAKASTGAESSNAGIHSFPFLYDLLAESESKKISVHLTRVPIGPLTIDKVDVTARGVHIDVGYLFSHHKVRLTSIASADARLTFAAPDITSVTGVQISITGNTIAASVGGASVPVTVTIAGGHMLILRVAGQKAFSFDVDRSPIIPPCALRSSVAASALVLECQVSPVPPSVVAAISVAASH